MDIQFTALETDLVENFQRGGADANGQTPERCISDGSGLPCRHCLREIEAGAAYLILALRPFPDLHPYAELGPIFLHAESCPKYQINDGLPEILANRPLALIKGYGADNRIKYGTGRIVEAADISAGATDIFLTTDVAYIHVRSATNNCYTCRIDRVPSQPERL
ncbi:MAG: DUF1203 domain-containing protein [Alphaproteobacteria bacterium]|nr:DUF1203 domain-containing protein [Alphaproteobacteria bacterium]MBL6955022.1 DUF1203 domain-containing protein [Alphaproteobacteria bacterium]